MTTPLTLCQVTQPRLTKLLRHGRHCESQKCTEEIMFEISFLKRFDSAESAELQVKN